MFMLIWNNIPRRRTQSALTVTITMLTVLVFVIVLGVFQTVNRGLALSRERLGADAVLIPKYATASGGDLLFTAIPENIYMDADVLEDARALEGVAAMPPQFYAQTLALSCCEPGEEARIIGYDASTDFILTLRENLLFTQSVGGKKDPKKVDGLLYRFGLEDRADFFPHQLSGGQRRRAMAARALLHDPTLILADEPTNDLDEHWSNEIIRILKKQTASGTAVVMVTHNSRWATEATRRCRLEDGVLMDVNNE